MPFPGGISAIENGTLLFSAVSALIYLMVLHRPANFKRATVKTLGVGLLCLLAWMNGGPWLLVVALGLGAAGDYFLAFDGERAFLAGLGSFLAAHLAYIALFASNAGLVPLFHNGSIWRLALLALVLIHGLIMARLLIRAVPGDLKLPVMVYIIAIIAMVAAALAWTPLIVVAGAFLFAFSDTVLAVERFLLVAASNHRKWTAPAVWITYYAAQLIIALAYLA